ncbi:hypothetical protein EDD16DRAFT_1523277 [Pisolithus croceorrhizus]|nr:hypothetical protein EDD16DRAFT_1523277 [Pisolithus croceorrhizus]
MAIPGGFGEDFSSMNAVLMFPHHGLNLRNTYVYYMMHCSEDPPIVKFLVAATCGYSILSWEYISNSPVCFPLMKQAGHTQYAYPLFYKALSWSIHSAQASGVAQHSSYSWLLWCNFCRRGVRWLVTAPIDLAWYYSVTPSAVAVVMAEVLITVSLCVILYDGGSYSECARAKRLIKTLITYAANRCLLTSIVVIAELAVTMGLNFIVGKSSLNAREHLRSQAMSILNIGSLHFADPPTLPKDRKNYKDGGGRFDVRELPDIDITEVGSDMTVMSRTDVEA